VQEEQDITGMKKTEEKQERAPNQGQGMTGRDKKGIQNGCPDSQGVNSRKRARMEAGKTGELTPQNQQCEKEMRERSRTRQNMDVGEHDGELTSNPGEEVEQGADTSAVTEEKALEEEVEKPAGKEGEQTDVYDFAKLTEEDSAFVQLLISMGEDSDVDHSADQNEQSTTRMMGRQQVEEPVPVLAVEEQSHTKSGNAVSAANLRAKSNSGAPSTSSVLGHDEQRHTESGNAVTAANLREEINSGAANTDISMQYLLDWVQSIFPSENRRLRYLSIAELANGSTNSSRYAPLVTHGILTFKKQLHKVIMIPLKFPQNNK
jgi:hypothetical protein